MLEKIFITGMGVVITSALMALVSVYTQDTKDLAAWITLSISAGIGIAIAITVDDKAEKSHQEVITSQDTIRQLLSRLDSTNQKHDHTLNMLDNGRIKNENTASFTVTKNFEYIHEYIETVLNAIDNAPASIKQKKDLISKTVLHIESPINIIEQAIQNTGTCLSNKQQTTMLSLTSILRKIIILATLDLDSKIDEIVIDLRNTQEKIDTLIKEVNPNHA